MFTIKQFLNQLEGTHGRHFSEDANRYINTQKKITARELDINFIKKCLNNETLPNFSRLNLANSNRKFISQPRKNITEHELTNKIYEKRKYEKELSQLQNRLFDLSPDE